MAPGLLHVPGVPSLNFQLLGTSPTLPSDIDSAATRARTPRSDKLADDSASLLEAGHSDAGKTNAGTAGSKGPGPVGTGPAAVMNGMLGKVRLLFAVVLLVVLGQVMLVMCSSMASKSAKSASASLAERSRKSFPLFNLTSPFLPEDPSFIPERLRHLWIPRTVFLTVPNKTYLERDVFDVAEQWHRRHPTFDIEIHDDTDMLHLVATEGEEVFPGALEVYTGFNSNVQRADFWRYLVVYLKGGVYVDSDVAPLELLETWERGFLRKDEGADWTLKGPAPYAIHLETVDEVEGGSKPPLVSSLWTSFFGGHPSRPHHTTPAAPSTSASSDKDTHHRHRRNAPGAPPSPAVAPLLQGFVGAEAVLSEEERYMQGFAFRVQWCQWAFAFRRRHPLLAGVIRNILERVRQEKAGEIPWVGFPYDVLMRTGPGVFTVSVGEWLKAQSTGRMPGAAGEELVLEEEFGRDAGRAGRRDDAGKTNASTVAAETKEFLTSEDIATRFEIVGGVGFMPRYAFGHRDWMDPSPPDPSLVLIKHLFKGSWKNARPPQPEPVFVPVSHWGRKGKGV
ncbi:membrane-bound alpha-1,6- mannosyltransferase Initiation-specific [Phlyctochytrium bullatum]|nr:membrane-bound alpha-1,6- mannosyltransferase Initiation-specific [Phlyctochytrium bullatum]